MKNSAFSLFVAGLLSACTLSHTDENRLDVEHNQDDTDQGLGAFVADAEKAVSTLASLLGKELRGALVDGGPVNAVSVCSTIAPAMARSVSESQGVTIRRISLKHRNEDMGRPSVWQSEVLQHFDERRAAGEDPSGLTFVGSTASELRYMKAIPTAPLCLTCHGVSLSAELAAELSSLYPNDMATGYQQGDVRGAFVVTRPRSHN